MLKVHVVYFFMVVNIANTHTVTINWQQILTRSPTRTKNLSNMQTEADIKFRIMLTLKPPITQSEGFLIMIVFQGWETDQLHLHADMLESHHSNNVGYYQLFLAEDVGCFRGQRHGPQ